MKFIENNHREKRRLREQRDTKKHIELIYYDSSEDNGYLKSGPYSAGDIVHKNVLASSKCTINWAGFGGYFNGSPDFDKRLKDADVLAIRFPSHPEDEPNAGDGYISLVNHINAAKAQNKKLKVFVLKGSIIDIDEAKIIDKLIDIPSI